MKLSRYLLGVGAVSLGMSACSLSGGLDLPGQQDGGGPGPGNDTAGDDGDTGSDGSPTQCTGGGGGAGGQGGQGGQDDMSQTSIECSGSTP